MKEKFSRVFAQLRSMDNVEYVLRDSNGNIKPMFQENLLAKVLLKFGILSPQWQNSKAAFLAPLLGSMREAKVIGNLVTTVGKALAAGRLMGSGAPAAATYIAVGTGTTAAAAGDTTLVTETAVSGLSRVAGTASLVTTTTTNIPITTIILKMATTPTTGPSTGRGTTSRPAASAAFP